MKTALVLRHVGFEDLGSFAEPLTSAGYIIRYHEVGVDPWDSKRIADAALLIVLGGPVGVYEADAYPFLRDELATVRQRLAASRPTLGICLGAQIIACALGARVAPGTKELGFAPVTLTEAGHASPLRHLKGIPVLHWHGDVATLPAGADLLATTHTCANQAFALGSNVLAVQFHPEADATQGIERWLIGHTVEIARACVDPVDLRRQAERHGRALREAGRATLAEWLSGLHASSGRLADVGVIANSR